MKYALNTMSAQELENIYTTLSQHECPSASALERANKKHYEYYLSVIRQWIIEARNGKIAAQDLVNLSLGELHELMTKRLHTYISGQIMLEANKEEIMRTCVEKVDRVLQLWKDDAGRKNTLIKLCLSKESDVVASMKTQSVDKLYEMSVSTADS